MQDRELIEKVEEMINALPEQLEQLEPHSVIAIMISVASAYSETHMDMMSFTFAAHKAVVGLVEKGPRETRH